jgi:GWxTD domain-containing protein
MKMLRYLSLSQNINGMRNILIKFTGFCGIIGFIAVACKSLPNGNLARRDKSNLSYIYNPGSTTIHPMVTVFNVSDSISYFYLGFSASELLFNQANATGNFLTQIRIHFDVSETEKSGGKLSVDTGTYIYNLKREQLKNVFYTSIPFRAYSGKQYMLRVYISDMMRNKSNQSFILVDKTNPYNDQNFLLHGGNKSQPFLIRSLNTSQKFCISYRSDKYSKLFVDFNRNRQPLPMPVYATEIKPDQLVRPDSSWVTPLNDTLQFNLNLEGIYQFRVDTNYRQGLALYNFGPYYPAVKEVDDMANPLVYISNSKESQEILASSNKKLALDNFWVTCTGNMEQARELIRIYYNRVFFANYYFTADREGWKTDRGMIFIVYGPPNTLYKSEDEEKWVYFKKPGESIAFTFRKADSRWTTNLYSLIRGQAPDTHWRQAVESWRSGKVFLLD